MEADRRVGQDEIISNTKNVLRGLETLKDEHAGLLSKLRINHDDKAEEEAGEQKKDMIEKSLEKIELGLGEAQVSLGLFYLFFLTSL